MIKDTNLPQFYQKPVILNRETHAGLTISDSPGRYLFASEAQTVLMAAVEYFDACRQFPVIFIRTPDERVVSLALMGLENNENLFVDEKGAWTGNYIPAYIRRYPFITTDGADGQMAVCFDEDFDGFNREEGLPLFENGEPTPKMKEILAFLQDYYGQIKKTEQLGDYLSGEGLLRQIDAQANLADGRSFALKGMLVVDEQKLAQLPDTEIVKIFRNGRLALINAHLLSLRNLNGLIDRKTKKM